MIRKMSLAIALCLSTTACLGTATPIGSSGTIATVTDQVVIKATQSLIVAHLAYQGVVPLVKLAVDSGLLRGEAAGEARDINDKILGAFLAADKAQSAAVKARYAAEAMDLIVSLQNLSRRSP